MFSNGFTRVPLNEKSASESLLRNSAESEPESECLQPAQPTRTSRFRWPVFHALIIFIYSTIFATAIYKVAYQPDHGPGLIYSPARSAVQYKKVLFHDDISALNPYRGPPRPELDAAWHSLLAHSNIRVSASDLARINRTSVKLSDGSGDYMAELNVHHQLHCLKVLRQALHPEFYPDAPQRHVSEHMDHCLDNLRQLIMCKADISLQTYDWVDNNRRPFANFKVEHECVDFEALDEWAAERSFDVFDGKTLVHPKFGPSFPVDDEGVLVVGDDEDPLEGKIATEALNKGTGVRR